jgi:hypothetical protein
MPNDFSFLAVALNKDQNAKENKTTKPDMNERMGVSCSAVTLRVSFAKQKPSWEIMCRTPRALDVI